MIRRHLHRVDRHWLRATCATLALAGLVAGGIGANIGVALAALAICGVGFGFFYLVFPGGSHFGVTVANALAVYACVFVYFRDANFAGTSEVGSTVALLLPVLGFLVGCFARRRRVAASIQARRSAEVVHLPRLDRWIPALVIVGAASFAMPRLGMHPGAQDAALIVSMAIIAAAVAFSARDVVVLLIDIAIVFEGVTARLDRLLMPVMAFLTFYSLLVVVFACLYRIADLTLDGTQFIVLGHAGHITFSEALYFSVITIATVGYGDITPAGSLVRGLASIEVVLGLLLLLFGFSEIMRSREPTKRGPDVE
jgi:voltage-gated potassium channel